MILQSRNPAKDNMTVVQLGKNVGTEVQNCTSISPLLLVSSCCTYCSLPPWSSRSLSQQLVALQLHRNFRFFRAEELGAQLIVLDF